MTDDAQAAPEAADEVVQPEAEQVEAAEAPESTKGQVEGQPAEDDGDDADSEEKVSASKLRREKRKQYVAQVKSERDAAQAEAEQLKARLAEYEAYSNTPPPKQDDFQDYDDYLAAKSAFAAMQAQDKRETDRLKREAEGHDRKLQQLSAQQMEAARENWEAQTEDARSRYADFDAVVSAPDLPITGDMAQRLALSDQGADIAYYLGMNKGLARQIAGLSPAERAGAMLMLERTVPSATPRARTQTTAPEPIRPVKPKSTGVKSVDSMSMAEYAAARKAGKII